MPTEYRCGVCQTTDPLRYERCEMPNCPDGHDQLPRYGVLARRVSGMGPALAWVANEDRSPMTFRTLEEARAEANMLMTTPERAPSLTYEGARIGRTF